MYLSRQKQLATVSRLNSSLTTKGIKGNTSLIYEVQIKRFTTNKDKGLYLLPDSGNSLCRVFLTFIKLVCKRKRLVKIKKHLKCEWIKQNEYVRAQVTS